MNQVKCNLLMVGKSGAGKSSFCNYLFNKPGFFEAGKGKPITNWDNNFQSFRFEVEGMPIEVFDTVGLEVNNYNQWITSLNGFLNEHSRDRENLENWIHGVFYVINSSSDRLEDLEKQIIEKFFFPGADLPVQIILTNCDIATEQQIAAIMEEVKGIDPNINIHQVNSVYQRFRNKTSEAFGRNVVLETFLSQSYHYVGKKVAANTINDLITYIQEQKIAVRKNIENSDLSIFKINKIEEFDVDTLLPSEESIVKHFKYLEIYQNFLDTFDVKYQGKNQLEFLVDSLEDIADNLSSSVLNKLERAAEKIELGSFAEKVSGLVTVAATALNIKKTLKNIVDEVFDQVNRKLLDLKYQIIDNQDS